MEGTLRLTRPVVLGGGSWGTALALVLARRGLPVNLWVHNPERASQLARTRINPYLPDFPLPEAVQVSDNLATSAREADVFILAVPSHAVRPTSVAVLPFLSPNACLISASKGIEENSLHTMSQVIREVTSADRIATLSGPSFAEEVAQELPTAIVAASTLPLLAQAIQQLFSGPNLRIYISHDVRGVELGGAIKNVIAIAAGVCHGLRLGHNAIAALITRGLAEMSRLARALGAEPQTLAGLAGLGDLVLTCNGQLSRNRQVGIQLASGKTVQEITAGMNSVAEGIKTTNSVVALGAREGVTLPICEQMFAVLHGQCSPLEAIRFLMERSVREE